MKKYILKMSGNPDQLGAFTSKIDAVHEMEDIIGNNNEDYDPEEEGYLTPFDFALEEIEITETNEVITNFEIALSILGRKDDELQITHSATHPHARALRSLLKLVTIAEAWNKADNFVPDFSNENQCKWFPWFAYDTNTAGFVYAHVYYSPSYTYALIGSRICFKTSERAAQFGRQFIDLWNDFLMM